MQCIVSRILRAPLWFCALLLALVTSHAAEDPASFKVSEFTFQRPGTWKWVKAASSMRAAQLEVGKADEGGVAEVVFFYFGPSNGGGTQANVERWLGQFKEPKDKLGAKVEEKTLKNQKVTFVQAKGTYMSGSPFGPKTPLPDHLLMGAILESKKGNVFVKMTGPTQVVQPAIKAFQEMVEGALK
jgi:hypothetical protein